MEKSEFIESAPLYYALAIAIFLKASRGPVTFDVLKDHYSERDDYNQILSHYLEYEKITNVALSILKDNNAISIEQDIFGPDLYEYNSSDLPFEDDWQELSNKIQIPFLRYNRIPHEASKAWLLKTLSGVNRQYRSLNMTDEDFERPDLEWDPIPLDRSEIDLKDVIEKIDRTIELVRSDNGYSSAVSEEQAMVLDNLSALSNRLKSAISISLPYLRLGVETMGRLVKRFGPAAIGFAAATAKEALKDWLKKRGFSLLDDL